MDFVSIRVITDDIRRLVQFYEQVTGLSATWYTDDFAELATPSCTLAIGSKRTMDMFGPGAARPADNHTAIIEFRVADVDNEYEKLEKGISDFVQRPTTHAVGKSLVAVSRTRRESDQLLYAGDPGGDQEVRSSSPALKMLLSRVGRVPLRVERHFERAPAVSASLIGRLGSSTFRLSAAAVAMSLTGSCFSSESAPRALPSWDSRTRWNNLYRGLTVRMAGLCEFALMRSEGRPLRVMCGRRLISKSFFYVAAALVGRRNGRSRCSSPVCRGSGSRSNPCRARCLSADGGRAATTCHRLVTTTDVTLFESCQRDGPKSLFQGSSHAVGGHFTRTDFAGIGNRLMVDAFKLTMETDEEVRGWVK